MFEKDNPRFDANRFAIACYKDLEMMSWQEQQQQLFKYF
jgi:hypothetical protein